jgi:hypothetical protein
MKPAAGKPITWKDLPLIPAGGFSKTGGTGLQYYKIPGYVPRMFTITKN